MISTVSSNGYYLQMSNGASAGTFGADASMLQQVFHYTPFTDSCIIYRVDPISNASVQVTSTVFVERFSVDYTPDLTADAVANTFDVNGGAGALTFFGQHQGVFTNNQWLARNSKEDPTSSVNVNVVSKLPDSYYALYQYKPDTTATKTIRWTVTCNVAGLTSVTFTNITQTIKNDWDKPQAQLQAAIAAGGEKRPEYTIPGGLDKDAYSSLVVTTATGAKIAYITIYKDTNNFVLSPSIIPGYVAGKTTIWCYVANGVRVGAFSNDQAAMTISGFSSALTITEFNPTDIVYVQNRGRIVGANGGYAITALVPTLLNNNLGSVENGGIQGEENVRLLVAGAVEVRPLSASSNITIGSNTANYSLTPDIIAGYVAGVTTVNVYVSSGVYVYSTDTATPAFSVSGFNATDTINITNLGYIMGKGGNGGGNSAGTAGGAAMSLLNKCNITNLGYIAGGGGGGAGGAGGGYGGGGGGAGGGNGGPSYLNANVGILAGGAGGAPGSAGADGPGRGAGNPAVVAHRWHSGAGGGRILPGTGGAGGTPGFTNNMPPAGGGAGGGGGGFLFVAQQNTQLLAIGGAGGAANAAGNGGTVTVGSTASQGGGGGGWGAAGGTNAAYAGGAAGAAITDNSTAPTFNSLGTVYGNYPIQALGLRLSNNSTNLVFTPAAVAGYVVGASITLEIEAGVYVYSTDTATPAITVSGFNVLDSVTILNNGYIMGKGGNGGYSTLTNGGYAGGTAISIFNNVNIINNSYIGGGGGGGGSGSGGLGGGGGGAGGGNGGYVVGNATFSGFGVGGEPGNIGGVPTSYGNGTVPGGGGAGGGGGGVHTVSQSYRPMLGAGGGRIFPGTGGAAGYPEGAGTDNRGGAGGAAGDPGVAVPLRGGGGGGWGASGGAGGGANATTLYAGGAGGKAIALNGSTATRTGAGTTYGAIS